MADKYWNCIGSIGTNLWYIQDSIKKINEVLNSFEHISDDEVIYYHLKDINLASGQMLFEARNILNAIQNVEYINMMNELDEENKKIEQER